MTETTKPSARSILGDAITAFEKAHVNEHGQVDVSDEDDHKVYTAMVDLLFGNEKARNG